MLSNSPGGEGGSGGGSSCRPSSEGRREPITTSSPSHIPALETLHRLRGSPGQISQVAEWVVGCLSLMIRSGWGQILEL